ncbi:MAG: transglycosylase SLT domain-containing protein [Methylophilaceae bacterium]|nr:transglycosylase SLT domain-containing protein [Methylophilaceae bacterium]
MRFKPGFLCFSYLLGSLLCLSLPAWALNESTVFSNARSAYQRQNEAALAEYTQQLQAQNYVLAAYADYWLMLLRLSQANNASVEEFLKRYADYPFADRVRGEWLKALGKRQDWPIFFSELPNYQREDTAVSCYALLGRAQQGDAEALKQGKPIWLVPTVQPDNCNALFDRMQKVDILTEDDLWARFRLALQEGKISVAKSAAQRLNLSNFNLLNSAYENPQKTLEKTNLPLDTRLTREVYLYALERVARNQPALALDLWGKLQSAYTQEERNYLWGRFALHAARRHDPTALEMYKRARLTQSVSSSASPTKDQLAWMVRAALRQKDWVSVIAAVDAMPPDLREAGAWRYWKGRALKEQKQIPAANAILVPLSHERHYYGLLALEELGDSINAPPNVYKATAEEISAVKNLPAVQRAFELQRLDMRTEARQEWAWALRNFDDKQLIAAAEVAFQEAWYDVAINTADKTRLLHDFELRYPTLYRDNMQNYARENQLDESWVYGLIRQESRFISFAKSGVGASGLMQIMPATAKWIAKRLGISDYSPGVVNQLKTNIQFGTHYLRYVLDQMNGQSVMATAAYNAGPGRPKRWAAAQALEAAIYIENIPFEETRTYVQKVMANAQYYAPRLGIKSQTLKQRLGVIVGSNGVVPADADANSTLINMGEPPNPP